MNRAIIFLKSAAVSIVVALGLLAGSCSGSLTGKGEPALIQTANPKGFAKAESFAATYHLGLAEWPLRPEERMVDTKAGRTHLLVWGPVDAPPLVVLHGAGGSALGWGLQAEAFASNHRVYALDIPGHYGLSVSTRPIKAMADLTAWLDETLDALKLSRIDLVGHSFGGQVALYYALYAPSRVNHLVLMAPGALHPLRSAYLLRAMTTIFGTRGVTESLLRYLGGRESDKHEPYETRLMRALDMSMIAGRHFGLMEMPWPTTLRDDELAALSMPTLLVLGEQEVIYDARKARTRAMALIPKVQVAMIAGAGHLMNLSHPKQLHAAITGFLSD